jgi:hypothetical protein
MEVAMLFLRNKTQRIIRKIETFLTLLIVSSALTGFSYAQQKVQSSAPKSAAPATLKRSVENGNYSGPQKLPLRRVVLYKSGIGYFQHDGRVRGNEEVEIDLTSGQLNDVLKSLTALDFSGGRIVGASYNSQEPAGHQLQSLPVPVAANTTLVSLLEELRGARLEVRNSAGAFTGRLLSVEEKSRREGAAEIKFNQISLFGDGGQVRTFTLDSGTTFRFADRDLEMELTRALGLMDSSHQEDTRHLVLSTAGTGDRQIRVSYISEVPVWKTTYRIVLPGPTSPEGTKPLLQGWAVVDNTVGEDWNDVELSLAAGAPQSFIQQLSQPYYMQRPTVGLPRNVLLSPQTHASTLNARTGNLIGTVVDPDGKAIAGANVRLLAAANNNSLGQVISDSAGRFAINNIPSGEYKLSVSMRNFKTSIFNSLEIIGGRTFELPAKLEVGGTSVTVNVEAGQQLLESVNTSTQTTITGRAITSLPLRSNNLTFEGLPKGSVNVAFDGINAQDNVLKSSDGYFAINDPRLDDVEEFGIRTSGNDPSKTGQGAVQMSYANNANIAKAMTTSTVAAQSGLLGDLFEYKLKDRVTILKNQSALVPIVQTEIDAEKVALWNANLGMVRPLRALWLKNSSDLVLDGGSFNVIEAGAFAGEGLMEPIHPGEKRLLSYAADLAIQVVAKPMAGPEQLTRIRIARGILFRTVQSRMITTYTIRNDDSSPRTVIIEQPIRNGWKLREGLTVEEETATAYRFRVEVKPKTTKDFAVEETSPTTTNLQLTNLNDNLISLYVGKHEFTPELEKSLRDILAQKDAIAKLEADLKEKGDEVDSIGDDQDRVRENLGALKGTAAEKALAQRYVKELDEQETRLATLKKEILDLEARRKKAQQELDDTIEHFTFDEQMSDKK